MSFTSTLTSPAPLPQSHKRLRTTDGKNNVNPNSNVSDSVIASSSRGRVRGRNIRNRNRSSRVRGNQKPSKTVDSYQWRIICKPVNTNVTAHPYFETSEPARSTSNYCEKCDLYICKDCFEKFHTRSKI